LSFDLGFLNFFLGFIYFGCFVGNLCVICLLCLWGLTIWCKCYISCVVSVHWYGIYFGCWEAEGRESKEMFKFLLLLEGNYVKSYSW